MGLTLLVALLTAIVFSLAGLINGIFAKKFDDISIVPTFILTPLTYLGGVFYSIELLSPFFRGLMYLNPIFYMVNAFRYCMLGYADIPIQISLLVLGLLSVSLYLLSLGLFYKGIGIRTWACSRHDL